MATNTVPVVEIEHFDHIEPMSPTVFHFSLESAYLCENCNNVSNLPQVCPSCACATAMIPLASILNRPIGNPSERVQKMCDELDSVLN
jgi:hypothetical protein